MKNPQREALAVDCLVKVIINFLRIAERSANSLFPWKNLNISDTGQANLEQAVMNLVSLSSGGIPGSSMRPCHRISYQTGFLTQCQRN